MSAMSMTAEAARRALDAAKRDDAFVNRYLDGAERPARWPLLCA